MQTRLLAMCFMCLLLLMLSTVVVSAAALLSTEELNELRGGCAYCEWYVLGDVCGIDLKCTDAMWDICIPIVQECRSNAYSSEYAQDWCRWLYHYNGQFRSAHSSPCGWRFDCWCDVGISGIGACYKKNGTHNQTSYDKCSEPCY